MVSAAAVGAVVVEEVVVRGGKLSVGSDIRVTLVIVVAVWPAMVVAVAIAEVAAVVVVVVVIESSNKQFAITITIETNIRKNCTFKIQ